MGKYDMPLDLETDNALAMIVKQVKHGSRVLEFGPAEGRLTRHLRKEMDCSIDIVEIDEESGSHAAAFADVACLGEIDGDIERGVWLEKVRGRSYDCIIFADVLEHLRNPERALRHCRELLAENGEMLVSVPNISHNAIIIGLMLGKFQYTPTGLLDNTHVHFFTYESFCQMAETAGWQVLGAEAALASLGHMEQPYDYTMVPQAVGKALKLREAGNVYQYVFRLGRKTGQTSVQIRNTRMQSDYVCECYVKSHGQAGWSAGQSIKYELRNIHEGASFEILFDVSDFEDIESVRLDPLNANCVLELGKVELQYEGRAEAAEAIAVNGGRLGDNYWFATDDPQFIVNAGAGKLCRVLLSFKLLNFDESSMEFFVKHYVEMQKKLDEKQTDIEHRQVELDEKQADIEHKQAELAAMQQYVSDIKRRGIWQTVKDFIKWKLK